MWCFDFTDFILSFRKTKKKKELLKISTEQLNNDVAWSVSTLKLVHSRLNDSMQSRLFWICVQFIRFYENDEHFFTQTSFGTALNNTSPMSSLQWVKTLQYIRHRIRMSWTSMERSIVVWVKFHINWCELCDQMEIVTHFTLFVCLFVCSNGKYAHEMQSNHRRAERDMYKEKDLKVLITNLKCGTRILLADRMLMIRLKNICFVVLPPFETRNSKQSLLWLCSNYMYNIKPDLWFWLWCRFFSMLRLVVYCLLWNALWNWLTWNRHYDCEFELLGDLKLERFQSERASDCSMSYSFN